MTERLYYTDAYQLHFEAVLLEQQSTPRGPAVRLDRTAFYPTSGGQPHDIGSLNGVPVVEVWADEDTGMIWHLLAAPLALPERATVVGQVDEERRRDHRQQHTGQHLLSAAFLRRLQAPTVSFHLGRDVSTIDLERTSLTWDEALAIEDEANQVIWENRPVTVHLVDPDDLERFHLRRPPQVTGKVRIIVIAGYDANPCGGTHVQQTGEIGQLKIVALERYKGGVRVSFVCGQRALRAHRQTLHLMQQVALALTVGQEEVPAAVTRLQEELKALRKDVSRLKEALLEAEAAALWEATPLVQGRKIIRAYWPERSFEEARWIAGHLRARPQTLVLLACGPAQAVKLVCARSDDWPELNAGALLRALLESLGGKGGGAPQVAQGGVSLSNAEALLSALDGLTVM